MTLTCTNCTESPPFEGFDTCLECSVAIALVEQPDYLEFARTKLAAHMPATWFTKLEREWARQLDALSHLARAVA